MSHLWLLDLAIITENWIQARSMPKGNRKEYAGLRFKDKCEATKIRSITKVADVKDKTRTLKWKWTGHMMRSQAGPKKSQSGTQETEKGGKAGRLIG